MLNHQPKPILVTGCYRSGTTVVEKILNMHPSITVASQPFPVLYFLAKEKFNRSIGIERRYPLDHLFLEDAYTFEEFDDFLQQYILDNNILDEFVRRMYAYSAGLWTPEILQMLDGLKPGSFFDVYAQLNQRVARLFPSANQNYVGGKEVLVEEFALPLIGQGSKTIFVIRDPRAMITSLNFRVRDNLTGDPRPILYSLRAWRKGVALAIAASRNGGGCTVRYEDLVLDPKTTLAKITNFLAVTPYTTDAFAHGINDQYGNPWTGNSSFTDQKGITKGSLYTYLERLPESAQQFIEAVCKPEMLLLKYEIRSSIRKHELALSEYRDSFEYIHGSFPDDYGNDPIRRAEEKRRLCLLKNDMLSPPEQRKWFITSEAYAALKTVCAEHQC